MKIKAPVIRAISSHTLYTRTDRLSKGGSSWLLGDFLAAFSSSFARKS